MAHHRLLPRALVAALALLLTIAAPLSASTCPDCAECEEPLPADTFVCGCPDPLPGEIAVEDLSGDVGAFVDIEVSITTNNAVSVISFDLQYPTGLIELVQISPGTLTEYFFVFGGTEIQTAVVRVTGAIASFRAIPPGISGTLATLRFEVHSAGCGSFCFVELGGHLAGYETCHTVSATAVPSSFDAVSWGEAKAAYR